MLRELLAVFDIKTEGVQTLEKANKELDTGAKGAGFMASSLAKLATSAALLGAVAGLTAFATSFATAADAVGKLSQKIPMALDNLQSLQYSAQLNGSSAEAMTTGIRTLSKVMADASGGSATARKSFDALGVSYQDANGKLRPIQDVLLDIGNGFKGSEDPTRKLALAQEVLGRSGMDLIPTLENLQASIEDYQNLGGGYTEEGTAAAAAFNDELLRGEYAMQRVKDIIFLSVQPAILKITEGFTWLQKTFNKLTEGTHVVEIAFYALAAAAAIAGVLLVAPFLPALLIMAKWALIIGVVVLALDDLWAWWEGKPSAFGKLLDSMFGEGSQNKVREWAQHLVHWVKSAVSGYVDLIIAGVNKVMAAVATLRGQTYEANLYNQASDQAMASFHKAADNQFKLPERKGTTTTAPASVTDSRTQTVNMTVNNAGSPAENAKTVEKIQKAIKGVLDTQGLLEGVPVAK